MASTPDLAAALGTTNPEPLTVYTVEMERKAAPKMLILQRILDFFVQNDPVTKKLYVNNHSNIVLYFVDTANFVPFKLITSPNILAGFGTSSFYSFFFLIVFFIIKND